MGTLKKLNRSWLSAAILKNPLVDNSGFHRGVLVINQVDEVLDLHPELSTLFIVVERFGWYGMLPSSLSDVKLVEDEWFYEETKRRFPSAVLLKLGPADFVDIDAFRPLKMARKYDGIMIACWSERKRIEMFIRAAALLPNRRFIHLGHYEHNGSDLEKAYKHECLKLAKEKHANVEFITKEAENNDFLLQDKCSINEWINLCSIGILTTKSEGINRFKMECLSADRPVLVPSDVACPTRKHINYNTGVLYQPEPEELARQIEAMMSSLRDYNPREYVLSSTGKYNSLRLLKSALFEVCENSEELYRFDDIEWDGRNDSQDWGEDACTLLNKVVCEYGPLT